MKVIYEPKGAALEYAPLAANLYTGCLHKCSYCYVPAATFKKADVFHASANPREGVIAALAKDAWELNTARDKRRILLCFACDPYPAGDSRTTRSAISALKAEKRPVSVLSKAGMRMTRDYDLLAQMDSEVGISLVWMDDLKRQILEPGAAPVGERLEALRLAKVAGLKTWASVEPVVEPTEGLKAIEALLPLADMIKIGRWNHDARANGVDWQAFVDQAKRIIGEHPVYWKDGLKHLV